MKTMMSERRNRNVPANSPTRRHVLAGVAMTFGGLALGLTKVRAATGEEISRTAESIHQEKVFKASRNRVYEALTDTKQFNEVTKISAAKDPRVSLEKAATEISQEVGGAFTLFGGIILGRHFELVPKAHRPGLARGQLGSRCLLGCEIRAPGARHWKQDCL